MFCYQLILYKIKPIFLRKCLFAANDIEMFFVMPYRNSMLNIGVTCLQLKHTVGQCRLEHFTAEGLIKVPNSLATADPTTKNIVWAQINNVHHTFGH
jgi:hypothetical protein